VQKLFNACIIFVQNTQFHRNSNIYNFWLNYTKMRISKHHFSWLYRSKFVCDFIKVSFVCFFHSCTHQS